MENTSFEHVILLSADALRADHLSCYGYSRDTTPNLDALADESIRFTNAYSVSSHTREAVPALLTGEYPDVAVGQDYTLETDTIASTFSDAGYATAGFHSNPFVSRAYGFDHGFDTFDDELHFGKHKLVALVQRLIDKLRNRHYARADEINDRSLTWIDSQPDDQPLFLWNHYLDTHGPYDPPDGYGTSYCDVSMSGRDAQSLYRRAIGNPESISQDEQSLLIDLYDAEIKYNDEKLGEFLDDLRARDILDQSLLVFTADHGDAFGEHGYFEHPRYLHEEITRVPLLVRPPGGTESQTVSTPVSTLDIAATFRDRLGLETPAERTSLLNIDPSATGRQVFLQARGEDENAHVRRYAVRTGNGSCFCERNRETDTVEFGACSTRTLRNDLDSHVDQRVRVENGDGASENADVDEEIERRLTALGYKE